MDSLIALVGDGKSDITWWQMSVRALVVFLFGLLLIRLAGRRAFGRQTPLDIIVSVIIGYSLSRALTGNSPLLPTLAATAALIGLHWAGSHLALWSGTLSWLLKGSPVWLIRDGQWDMAAARNSGITEGDIAEAMRSSGVTEKERVRTAVLERNGKISIAPQ